MKCTLCVLLIAAPLFVGDRPCRAAGRPRPLAEAARRRLDRVALRQAPETLAQEHVNQVGSVPAWLLAHIGLPESEELARARSADGQLRKREKVTAPPAVASGTLNRLLRHLPAHLRGQSFHYGVFGVRRDELVAFSPGGGFVYVSQGLARALLAEPRRGEAALAFALARELGHIGLHHCRRGWQRVVLEEEAREGIASRFEPGKWRDALDTTVSTSGALVQFLYTRDQEYEADLFALHLCRNAGYDVDECLDLLRLLSALRHPQALVSDDFHPPPAAPLPATLAYYLSPTADPLLRLRRLLMERAGRIDAEKNFGLFLYDRATGRLERAADRSVSEADRPLVFVHGLRGGLGSFRAMLAYFGERRELLSRKILVFRHPGNASLARSGHYLANEVARVLWAPASATFICHSAGGLVFRCYAEKHKGAFEHAVLLGTPNEGSDLIGLKFLVDLADLAGDAITLGPAKALAEAIPDGKGEIAQDLHPDSLFLRYLGHDPRLAARYDVFVGEYLTTAQALALRVTLAAGRGLLRKQVAAHLPPGVLRAAGLRWAGGVGLPREVLQGDLVVSTASARLRGARRVTKVPLNHLALRTDPDVRRQVLAAVLTR